MKDIGYLLNRIKSVEPKQRTIYDPKQVVQVMQVINPSWVCGELELNVVNALTNTDNWVFLQGNRGCGKTMLVRLWSKAINVITGKKIIVLTTDECGLYYSTKGESIIFDYIKSDLILDELGVESETFPHYHGKMDVISQILRIKYENRYRLIATTNLSRSQLMHRYGERVVERIEELGFVFKFTKQVRPVLSKLIEPPHPEI